MKNEFKGTKGKWYYEQDAEFPTLHNIWSDTKCEFLSKGTLIARTRFATLSKENALLMSKAPELLYALVKCEIILREIYQGDTTELKELLHSATNI